MKLEGKKLLLVTEYVESGLHLKYITDMLEDAGIDYEVACFWTSDYKFTFDAKEYDQTPRIVEEISQKLGSRLHIGGTTEYPETVYKKAYSGVRKSTGVFSTSTIKVAKAKNDPKIAETREGIRFARLSLQPVVEEVVSKLRQTSSSE